MTGAHVVGAAWCKVASERHLKPRMHQHKGTT
jgi:hypothetical protein